LWGLRIVIWNTPNNVLHESGYGNAVTQDLIINSFFGLVLAVFVYKKRKVFKPKLLYWSTLAASSMLAITPVAFLLIAFVGVMFFEVTV
jgi:hypothetical protein